MPPWTNTASQHAHVQNAQDKSLATFLSSCNWTIPAGLKWPTDSFSVDDYGRHVRQRLTEDMRNAGLVSGIAAQNCHIDQVLDIFRRIVLMEEQRNILSHNLTSTQPVVPLPMIFALSHLHPMSQMRHILLQALASNLTSKIMLQTHLLSPTHQQSSPTLMKKLHPDSMLR